MNEPSPLRLVTAELIGYGTAGTILDAAYEILEEIDYVMAGDLEVLINRVMEKFKVAEDAIWGLTEVDDGQ